MDFAVAVGCVILNRAAFSDLSVVGLATQELYTPQIAIRELCSIEDAFLKNSCSKLSTIDCRTCKITS